MHSPSPKAGKRHIALGVFLALATLFVGLAISWPNMSRLLATAVILAFVGLGSGFGWIIYVKTPYLPEHKTRIEVMMATTALACLGVLFLLVASTLLTRFYPELMSGMAEGLRNYITAQLSSPAPLSNH